MKLLIKDILRLYLSKYVTMHHKPFDHFIYSFGKLTLYKALLKCNRIELEN